MLFIGFISLAIIILLGLALGVCIVPQKEEYIIERFGKYNRTLKAGLNIIVPIMDRVAYKQSRKEITIQVPAQEAITKDNIGIIVGGNIYVTVIDSQKASYNIDNWMYAISQLSQTVMRSSIGEIDLDETFCSRAELNTKIVAAVSERSIAWGVAINSYELNEVEPPATIKDAMELQMKAARTKRSEILKAEGLKESAILKAQGEKESGILKAQGEKETQVLAAEGLKSEQILHAEGAARAVELNAIATANALAEIAEKLEATGGKEAAQFELAKRAIEAKRAIAKEGTIVMLSDKQGDPSETVAQAMVIASTIGLTEK